MSFDLLAPHYRWMECLLAGNKLQRCRTTHLPRVIDSRRVLMVGEGTGRFLHVCRRAMPLARITVVDSSRKMLDQARLRASADTEFIHADALEWRPNRSYDLLSVHFFLDCFPADQLGRVIANLSAGAGEGARMLVSDFQVPERGWRRARARAIHAGMYLFFRSVTRLAARRLVCPDEYLRQNGFQLVERQESEWGLLRSDLWQR